MLADKSTFIKKCYVEIILKSKKTKKVTGDKRIYGEQLSVAKKLGKISLSIQ